MNGKGQEQLQSQGISCQYFESAVINDFYQSYAFWTKTHRPFVTAKIAISLDGKYGLENKRVFLTSELFNAFTHQCRKQSDAILTSLQTILKDNPRLDARVNGDVYKKKVYILDPKNEFKNTYQINETALSVKTFSSRDLKSILKEIGQENVQDLFIECGGKLLQSFLNENLIQKLYVVVTPKIIGKEGLEAFKEPLKNGILKKPKIFDEDVLYEWNFICSQE